MNKIKKLMITLVALLAVTTGAWATDAYEEFTTTASWTSYDQTADHFRVTGSYGTGQGLSIGSSNNYSITIAALNSETISKVEMTIGNMDMASWIDGDVISSTAGSVSGSYAENGTITVDNPNASTVTLSAGERFLFIKAVKVYYTEGSSSSGPEVAWDAAEKTGSFTMPGGNVELEPEYDPQAVLATGGAPTAITDVPATTDGAIVNAGTVATIGETSTAQGTVMYYVSTTALDDAALLALDADAWTADVPTAESFTAAGQAYVYYYVRGNDSDTDDEIFSDGDILSVNALTVTIAAAPTYAVTFANGTDLNEWTASPNANVTKDTKVTVTYTGSKKVIGVKAEKKAAKQLYSFTLIGPYTDIRLVVEFYEGDTWEDMVTKYSTTLSIIAGKYVGFSSDGNVYDPTTHKWVGKTDQLVPNRAYYVQ